MGNIALLYMLFYALYAYLAIMTLVLDNLPEPLREDGVRTQLLHIYFPFSS